MPRLFVAAWPSDHVRHRLDALPRPDEPGVRWVSAGNWHVTLRFLGEVDVDEATTLLGVPRFPRCTATLGPDVSRLGSRQLVIAVDGVDRLAEVVRRATASIGEPDRHRFRGHLTVARTKPGATSSLVGAPFDAEFDIEQIVLVRSELRPTGAVYETIATFPTH